MIIDKTKERLRDIVKNKENIFLVCQSQLEKNIIEEIFSVEFDLSPRKMFPFILHIGHGKPRFVIAKDEMPENSPIENIGLIQNGESWRYCGVFDKHYDYKAKQWQDNYVGLGENPYKKCFFCDTDFEPDDIIYQCFTGELHSNNICRLRCICKKCAYKYSDIVTDYELNTDGNVEIKKWNRNN